MSLYRLIAPKAGAILVWIAVLLFVATFALAILNLRETASMSTQFGGQTGLDARGILIALVQSLNAAVWPLVGAGIIFALEARMGGSSAE